MNDQYYFNGCDLRFYSAEPIWDWGGYAWLANSSLQVKSPSDLTAQRIVHLHWRNSAPTFHPDSRYQLLSSTTLDQQVTDTYELKAN
jgi:hypothetical protein